MSEFRFTNSPSSSKYRKLGNHELRRCVSIDSLDDVLSLESSRIGLSRDEPREDSSSSESKFSSEVGSSGYALVSEDDGSPPFEGLDCPFILPNEWEVNKHCYSIYDNRLAKLCSEFQIPYNVPTRIAEIDEKCYSCDGEGVGLYKASFISGLRLPLNELTRKLLKRLCIAISQLAPNSWHA